MPTPDELERLKALAAGGNKDESDPPPRDSKVHLSLHVGTSGEQKSEGEEKKKNPLEQVAASPWVKLLAAALLGAGGGEGHRLLSPTGIVEKADLDHHKEEVQRELGREDGKIDTAKQAAIVEATRICDERLGAQSAVVYAMGRYLYYVLPKTGVLVTLPEGVKPPEPVMEFHPAPLVTGVTPGGAHPIQPKETFPLPLR